MHLILHGLIIQKIYKVFILKIQVSLNVTASLILNGFEMFRRVVVFALSFPEDRHIIILLNICNTKQSTWHNISEDSNLQKHRRENPNSHIVHNKIINIQFNANIFNVY